MATRLTDTRHQRLTRIGDLLDELADWALTRGAAIVAAFGLGAVFGVALVVAVLHRVGRL